MLPCTKSWESLLEHNLELGYRNQKGNLLSSKRFGHPALLGPVAYKVPRESISSTQTLSGYWFREGVCVSVTSQLLGSFLVWHSAACAHAWYSAACAHVCFQRLIAFTCVQ